MSGLSYYAEKKLLDWLFGGASLPDIQIHYYAFLSAVPTRAGIVPGTEIVDGSANPVRAALANTAGNYSAFSEVTPAKYLDSNPGYIGINITVPPPGPVVALAVMDHPTAGNMLAFCPLDRPLSVRAGDTIHLYNGTKGPRFSLAS